MTKPTIAIVGGGIGGTTLASLLQKAGYPFRLFEQAQSFARVGAGINFGPNATRVFRHLGKEAALLRVGIKPLQKHNRDLVTGHNILSVDTEKLAQHYDAPFLACHRGDLHSVLVAGIDKSAIVMGKQLRSVSNQASGVRLEFEDGTIFDADAVVGADGVNSAVRNSIIGDAPASYSGRVAYRSIYPRKLVGDLPIADNTRWWGNNSYVLTYFLNEARDEVFLVTGGVEEWGDSPYTPQAVDQGRLLAAFPETHEELSAVLRCTRDITRWPLLVREPGLAWTDRRVTLLGDACHPMLPHMGQGGGMAVEDAMMLLRLLEATTGHDPEAAFIRYQEARFARTKRVQIESCEDRWGYGKMDHQWLYGFDVVTAPLEELA